VTISNILNLRKGETKSRVLWGNILFTLFLFLMVLYLFEVPQGVQAGRKGQIALKALDGLSHPMLNIKAVVSQFQFDRNVYNAKSELERLLERAKSRIHHYKTAANYSDSSSKNAASFATAYYEWFNAEHEYIEWYSESHVMKKHNIYDEEYYLIERPHENNVKFLAAMEQLHDGEPPLHDDIAKGQKAYNILQWTSGLLIVYLFAIIFLFQRNSNYEHVVREKNLEMTLRSIGDAVIATDIHGRITCMNPEAERLTGWLFKDAIGYELPVVLRIVNAHSGLPVDDLVERVQQEKGVVIQAEDSILIAPNGNRYQIYENGAPILDDANEILGVVLVFRDITQQHKLKNHLSEKTLRLQRVIDVSMDAVIVMDEQGMINEWNPAAENMFGWSYAEVKKKPVHDIIIPKEFRERHLQGMQQLLEDDEISFTTKNIESLALHRDGYTFPIDLAMTSIRTENGWVFNAFLRDLSDQKKNEKLINKHNVILRETQRIAKLGSWELDLVNGGLEWSDEVFRMFGLDPATSEPSYRLFINVIHPEDRERVNAAYSESLKNKTPYNIIHRILTNEGIRIVHETCETSFDDEGRPLRSLGMVQDITERKQAEESLQQVNMIIDSSPVVLFRWQATEGWPVEFVSDNVSQFGYTVEELVSGNTPFSSIVHPDDLERVAQEMEEYSSTGVDLFTQEYRIVSPAGEVYWIHDRTVVDRDTDGTIMRYQGVVLDISERAVN